ncbi:MAG: FimV/HubP family polar landmark protein [Pseudomonadales bacterium]
MLRSAVRTIGLTGALFSSGVFALGLGDMKLYSAVNEPLRAEIKLLKVGDLSTTQVLVKLASLQDFERANVDREFFLTGMRYEVVLDGRGGGLVRVSTDDPVREPYLNFLLEAKWPSGRLVREYTLLLDLPAFTSTSSQSSTALQAPQSEPAPAPIVNNYELEESESTPVQSAPAPQQRAVAPAPAPSTRSIVRDEPQKTAEPSYGSDEYKTQKSDTLWQIAKRVQPSNQVTVNQTLIALQNDNPDAFINGNINRLKVGQVLRIPDESRVRDIANNQARLEVARQMQEWRTADDDVRQFDARAQASGSAPTASNDTRGTLSLSSAGGAGINGDPDGNADPESIGLNARLTDVMAELSSATAQNDNLSSQVQELLGEMEELKNKLELRNSQLAQLQAQGAVDSENIDFETAPDASVSPEVQELDFEQSGQLAAADDSNLQGGSDETLDEEPAAEKPKPAPVAKKESFFDKLFSPIGLGAIGGLLALLAGLFLWRRRKNAEDEFDFDYERNDEEAQLDSGATAPRHVTGTETGFASTPIMDEDTSPVAAPEQAVESSSIEAEMGDPIAEADIYVAYGRYPQAVELLNRAIEQEPERSDLVAKLVEVHSASGDREAAAAQLSKLEMMGMGAAVGAGLAASSDLSSANDDEPAPDVMEEFRDTLPDDQDMDFSSEFSDEGTSVDQSLIDSILGTDENEDGADDEDNVVAFDEPSELLDDVSSADIASDDEVFSLDTVTSNDDDGLDFSEEFDLELDLDDGSDEESTEDQTSNELNPSDLREALADGNNILDANFASHDSVQGLDLDLELDDQDDFQPSSGIEQGLAAVDSSFADADADNESYALDELDALDDIQLDLDSEGEIDIEAELNSLDEGMDDSSLEVISSAELSDLELEMEQTALDGDDDEQRAADIAILEADETATKLDLARAYVDMGDTDGARDILDEVIQEGSALDKQQAKELLDRIA